MSKTVGVRGVVVRESTYGESDKCITVLTDSLGAIPVICKGAKNYKSRFLVCAQLFCYSEFELYARGNVYWIKEASLIENFFALRSDITSLSLAQYFCEAAGDVTRENMSDDGILSLLLNSLFALSKKLVPYEQIKATYEIRLCALAGFCPDFNGCAVCGHLDEDGMTVSVSDGALFCREHRKSAEGLIALAGADDVAALRFALYSPPKKIFSAAFPLETAASTAKITEKYILYHLDRSFRTLEFYHTVKNGKNT